MLQSIVKSTYQFTLSILFITAACSGFGKNKVQYTDFSWNMKTTPHFLIYSHQNQQLLTSIAPYWIEAAYSSLHTRFSHEQKDKIPVIIYGNTNLFVQTNIITEILPEEVGGFTELFKNRIAIPFNGSYKDFRHVLHHELVHGFMFGILFEHFGSNMFAGNLQLPLWFMEGAAEFFSSRWDTDADMFLIDRALNSYLPPPGPGLNGYLAYKGGQSFLFYLSSSRGDSLFQNFLMEFKKTKRINNAIKKVYRKSIDDIGEEWTRELRRLYWPEIGCRINPELHAIAITNHEKTRDHYNLRPRISPDGKHIAFFSDRRDYTRILISDHRGKIIREISQTGYGGYFESFHPFRSGMCWSPDGNKIAFVTKSGGSDEIRIVDITRKKLQRRIRTRLSSISSPDWSPDGTTLIFTSVDSGKSELYQYNLEKSTLTRLTNSIEYEADPRFSPDGKSIIFSLEDTSGHLPSSRTPYGSCPSDLAILERSTNRMQRLTSTPWSEKQPGFSPDGKNIYFVSNRNGIDNIYIAPVDSPDQARPVTNYTGGSSNPDWSSHKNSMVFSLFNNQGWDVWMLDEPTEKMLDDSLTPTRWVASFNDSTIHFFTKVSLPADSTDSIGISIKETVSRTSSDSSDKVIPDINKLKGTAPTGIFETIVNDSVAEMNITTDDATDSDSGASTSQSTTTIPADTTAETDISLHTDPLRSPQTQMAEDTITIDTLPISAVKPYRLKFSPDMVSVGLGVSTVYNPAGQILIALSDLMGDHRITFAGDLQGNFNEYIHLFLSYLYLKNRFDLGVGGFYSKDYALASIFGLKLYHETEYGGFGIAQYPFSMFSRLDLYLLARHIEQKPLTFSGPTLPSNILQTSLSYVFDNILWGITGPLNGIRAAATVQFSPPLDMITESYLSFDADIRHYFHLFKRFVWANRLFLGGSIPLGQDYSARRYLLGGNDQSLLFQVNLDNYESNMRYSFYSDFVTPLRGWNYADFYGTRVAVFNSEFRFPFIREISIAWPLPMQIKYINGAAFVDVGNAWEAGERFGIFPLPDKIYGGFGFGLRANLGVFIVRFDRGWPTDWSTSVGTPINYFSLGAEF